MVLGALECDGANTSLNGHSAEKKKEGAVLVLVCCHKVISDREQDL